LVFLFMSLIFKGEKRLFIILILWFLTLYFASSILLIKWLINPLPYSYFSSDFLIIETWFSRLSFFYIFPLSILGSLVILNLVKKFQNMKKRSFYITQFGHLFKAFFISVFIFFLISNNFQSAIDLYNKDHINNHEAEMLGWISKNIPFDSTILVDNVFYDGYIRDILFNNRVRIDSEIVNVMKSFPFLYVQNKEDENCSIKLYQRLGDYSNVLAFQDNNNTGTVSTLVRLNEGIGGFDSGWMSFDLLTSNSSKNFKLELLSMEYYQNPAISMSIASNKIQFFNGTGYQKIMDIESNKWYSMKMYFETTNLDSYNLGKYHWKISINSSNYGAYPFLFNASQIYFFYLESSQNYRNWTTYLTNFSFPWDYSNSIPFEYNIVRYPVMIEDFREKEFNYLILSGIPSRMKSLSMEYIDIQNDLIPHFFNHTLYNKNGISIYSSL